MNIAIYLKKIVIIEIDADDAWELCKEIESIPTSGPSLPLLTELYNRLYNENLQ